VKVGAPWPRLPVGEAEARVLGIQTKLHRWAADDRRCRFDDLFNLVCAPAFLLVGWRRVRGNKGARSAGVDGQTAYHVERERGEAVFLAELRADLKAQVFAPLPVRERMIPKSGGKQRRLGIPTVASNCTSCRSGWGWWREVGRVGDLLAAGGLDLGTEGHAPAAGGSSAGLELTVLDPVVDGVGADCCATASLVMGAALLLVMCVGWWRVRCGHGRGRAWTWWCPRPGSWPWAPGSSAGYG
jgi:hypothetical protein